MALSLKASYFFTYYDIQSVFNHYGDITQYEGGYSGEYISIPSSDDIDWTDCGATDAGNPFSNMSALQLLGCFPYIDKIDESDIVNAALGGNEQISIFMAGTPLNYSYGRDVYANKFQTLADPFGFNDYDFENPKPNPKAGSSSATPLAQGWYELGGYMGISNRANRKIHDANEKLKKIKEQYADWDCKEHYDHNTPFAVEKVSPYTMSDGTPIKWFCIDLKAKNRSECLIKNPSNVENYYNCLNRSNKQDVDDKLNLQTYSLLGNANKQIKDLEKDLNSSAPDMSDLNQSIDNLKSFLSNFKNNNNITISGGGGKFDASGIIGSLKHLAGVISIGTDNAENAVADGLKNFQPDGSSQSTGAGKFKFGSGGGSNSVDSTKKAIDGEFINKVDDAFIANILSSVTFGIRNIFLPVENRAVWTDITASVPFISSKPIVLKYSDYQKTGVFTVLRVVVLLFFGLISLFYIFKRIV